jgi:hypothetical protein
MEQERAWEHVPTNGVVEPGAKRGMAVEGEEGHPTKLV